MSKLVTFEQAKKLATICNTQEKLHQFKYNDVGIVIELGSAARMYNIGEEWNAPTIHEALDWFREVKGFVFEIKVSKYTTPIEYMFRIYQYCPELRCYENESHGNGYLTHSEAESALLDALIKYVSK